MSPAYDPANTGMPSLKVTIAERPTTTRRLVTPVTTIISGGQTGADRTGLEVARELGLQTGGVCPLDYRTEDGPDPSLAQFDLVCHPSPRYQPRTECNVELADATVWFGDVRSPGGKLTARHCRRKKKPLLVNPTPAFLRTWLRRIPVRTLNVAGNRASTNPGVVRLTRATLIAALTDEED